MSRTVCDTLLRLLKTVETSTSVRYRLTSYPTGIVSGTESLIRPCSGSFRFERRGNNEPSVHTLGGARFHAPCAESGFSNRTSFLLSGSMTSNTLLESSLWPLLLLRLRGTVLGGSPKWRCGGLVYRRLFKRGELVGVIGKGLPLSTSSLQFSPLTPQSLSFPGRHTPLSLLYPPYYHSQTP